MNYSEFLSRCSFSRLTPELQILCKPFSCGNKDLDDFFREDYLLYGQKLLGKTYVFREKDHPENIVSAFTVANDSIRIKPNVVHSIVATENTTLHEVSTPFLDDTIRVRDFYTR